MRKARSPRAAPARGRLADVIAKRLPAQSWPLHLLSQAGVARPSASLTVRAAAAAPETRDLTAVQAPTEEAVPAGVFPIRGKHDMGQTATVTPQA